MQRPARFVVAGAPTPPNAIAVDGNIPGAELTLSHWPTAPLPPDGVIGDTGTELVLSATHLIAQMPDGPICIEHLDADGLIAVVCACRPDAVAAHHALLIAAAACGDFCAWGGAPAFRVMATAHRLIRDEEAIGGPWQQRVLDRAVADPSQLWRHAAGGAPRLDAAAKWLERMPAITIAGDALLAQVAWTEVIGHRCDVFVDIDEPDDAPIRAWSHLLPDTAAQLSSWRCADGWRHVVDTPRHAWARTMRRSAWRWRDPAPAAAQLQSLERGPARWTAKPACSFTGWLAGIGGDGAPAASTLEPAEVVRIVRAALEQP